jgi:hypothetical protein
LRVGIGDPAGRAVDHVLSRFTGEEHAALDKVIDAAADAVEEWARLGVNKAATHWNAWQLGGDAEALRTGANPVEREDGGGAEGAAGTHRSARQGEEPVAEGDASVGPDGIRRTRTGWRKILGWPGSADAERER